MTCSCLNIDSLCLAVHIGEGAEERKSPQDIELSIKISFDKILKLAKEDKGKFVCYDKLCRKITEYVGEREFRYIEYMAHCLHDLIKEHTVSVLDGEGGDIKIWLKVHKCNPPMPYITSGTSYEYGD